MHHYYKSQFCANNKRFLSLKNCDNMVGLRPFLPGRFWIECARCRIIFFCIYESLAWWHVRMREMAGLKKSRDRLGLKKSTRPRPLPDFKDFGHWWLRLQPSITSPMVSEKSSKWNKTRFWVDRGDRDIILLGMRPPPPLPPPLKSLPPLPYPWKRWKSRKSMKILV